MKSFIKKYWHTALFIVLGNLIYSFGIIAFIEPQELITGGVTGLSLFIHYQFKFLPVSILMFIFNAIFFILGLVVLGKKFALSTLASSIINPICIASLEFLDLSAFQFEQLWLSLIAGGACIGFGLGLVMRVGASTGGVDIIAIMINRKFSFITMGFAISAIDIIILLIQLTIKPLEFVLYGIVLAAIYSGVIDKIVMAGNDRVEVLIISKKEMEIRNLIMHQFDRGVTLLHSKTGYLENELDTILTVIDIRDIGRVKERVYNIDPDAFLVISKVSEVGGRGFTSDKKYLANKS